MHVYLIEMKLTSYMINDSNEKFGSSFMPLAIDLIGLKIIGQVRKYLTPFHRNEALYHTASRCNNSL